MFLTVSSSEWCVGNDLLWLAAASTPDCLVTSHTSRAVQLYNRLPAGASSPPRPSLMNRNSCTPECMIKGNKEDFEPLCEWAFRATFNISWLLNRHHERWLHVEHQQNFQWFKTGLIWGSWSVKYAWQSLKPVWNILKKSHPLIIFSLNQRSIFWSISLAIPLHQTELSPHSIDTKAANFLLPLKHAYEGSE